MASTWTDEQTAKYVAAFKEAFNSGLLATGDTECWNYIAKKVGDGKNAKDCEDYCDELINVIQKDGLASTWTDYNIHPVVENFHSCASNLQLKEPTLSTRQEMPSTWTDKQTEKYVAAFKEAFNSGLLGTGDTECWNYIAKKVGDGKNTKDCEDYCDELINVIQKECKIKNKLRNLMMIRSKNEE